MEAAPELTYLEYIKNVFDDYNLSYIEFIKRPQNYQKIKRQIDDHFETEMENELDQLTEDATEVSGISEVREDFCKQIEEQYEIMHITEKPDMTLFDEEDWDIICYKNNFDRQRNKSLWPAGTGIRYWSQAFQIPPTPSSNSLQGLPALLLLNDT